jgi:hypothetical protein
MHILNMTECEIILKELNRHMILSYWGVVNNRQYIQQT